LTNENTRREIAKSFLGHPFITIILFVVGGIVIAVAPDRVSEAALYVLLGISLIVAAGVDIVINERISRQLIVQKYNVLDDEKKRLEKQLTDANKEIQRQPRIAYYGLAQKTVKIANAENGDADIYHYFECKNTKHILRNLRQRIEYDATEALKRGEMIILVNGVRSDFTADTVTNCKVEGGNHSIKKFVTTLCIKLDPPMGKDQTFTYEYGIKGKGIYPKVKTDEGEVSSHNVMHQTDLLRFRVYAPDRYEFTRCWIEIQDYNATRDTEEEADCLAPECAPKRIHDSTEILWDVKDPKITYTYKLYFKLGNRTEPTQ